MRRYKFGLVGLFGLLTFFGCCSSFELPGFNQIYSHHFNSCNIDSLALGTPGNVCDGSTRTLYSTTDLGIYCVSLENLSISDFSSSNYNNTLSIGLGIIANNNTANNSYLRLSQSTLAQYSAGTNSNNVILCGTNFISGKKADFLITFTSTMTSLFNNNSLSFDMKMYYMPYNFDSTSLCSSYISELSTCQSTLSGYSNTLDSCSSNLNSCQSSLSSCLQSNCPVNPGEVSRSALYINNIQYLSSPIVRVDIPEEFEWDYSVEDDTFNLDVEGYNVDSDYIEGIINLQKSTPTNQDFNNIITGIIPLLVPGLVIILFIIFIFRFIKKIF